MSIFTLKILLVDDCLEDLQTYRRYLLGDKQHNYRILEASTGEEALLLCRQQFPDVIVMDYLLLDMDGLEFLDNLKTQFGQTNLPVIILTDRGNEQIAVQAMKGGAVDYLVKKNTGKLNFIKAVENVLEKTRLTSQEVALRESEARYRTVSELASDFIYSCFVTPQGTIIYEWMTPNLSRITGYTFEELPKGENGWFDLIYPDDHSLGTQFLNEILTSNQPASLEYRIISKQGEVRWIRDRIQPHWDETQGRVVRLLGIVEDISDRKQTEEALRRSEEQRRLVLDLTHTGCWDWNILTNEVNWNENHYYLLGLIPNSVEASYQTWRDRVHPEDIDRVKQAVKYALDTQTGYETEYRVIHPDGSHHWLMARGRGLYDESGQAVRMIGMLFDISDRKQAQEKIQEQATLLDVATHAIFVRDLQCRILYWNSGAERLYGWQRVDVLSKDCCEFLYEQISDPVEEALRTVVEQGEWQGELNKITKSGKEIIVQSHWTLMRDAAGQPKSILAVDTDITEKKQLQQQFYRVQRLESLGTLASGIAHDLNNILTPILTVAQLLRLKLLNLNEQNRQLLKILEDSSKRGAELVKQITAFARGAEGKRVPLQLRHLLKEIERVLKSTFPKSIEICVDIPMPNLWTVLANPTQIHQVLINLCVNARDAMPDGGTLSISAENFCIDENYTRMNLEAKVGNYVVITVSDTGCGMPQEVKERIFEPFFTTKEPDQGTGLGLSTVTGIIKNHHGFINVHSEVGEGSQFQVYLSAIDTSATREADDSQMALGNGELILVVDDEAFVRDVTKTSLEQFNYRVLTASDSIEAFSLYAQHKNQISVVLIDIQIPSIDGLNAIRVLQQMNLRVKIIAISGAVSNRKLLKASGIRVQAFLSKPYTVKELLNAIKDVLSAS